MKYLTLILLFSATIAEGQTTCVFTTECVETESCAETEFELSYSVTSCPRAPGPRYIIASTDFGDIDGREVGQSCGSGEQYHDGGALFLYGDGATYLLSLSGVDARLTTHVEGPMSITYIGQCEAPQ